MNKLSVMVEVGWKKWMKKKNASKRVVLMKICRALVEPLWLLSMEVMVLAVRTILINRGAFSVDGPPIVV